MLLDAGGPLDAKASSGGTALMFAAAAGYTDVVKLLLERGGDVNATVKVTIPVVLYYSINSNVPTLPARYEIVGPSCCPVIYLVFVIASSLIPTVMLLLRV